MSEPITVLITDMEGSTAYTEGQGDEVGMDLIRTHERLIRDIVERRRGREIKSMGDGFMIAFDEPDAGIACALDIFGALDEHNGAHPDDPIRVRMGMNRGLVIEESGDIYGTTVNAASRITAKARSGQLLVSETVHDTSSGGDWRFVDSGLFWLKGLRERWRLYEATRDTGVKPLAPASHGRSRFVGREDERAALRLYVDATLEGRGGLVLLSGEPGAGKTRLAEEVGAEAAGRGMDLFVGRCYEATRAHPFAPFIEILEAIQQDESPLQFLATLGEAAPEIARIMPRIRQRYPDLPPAADLPPEQERRYLFSSLREVLVSLARKRPLYLILDDIQWADDASLLFLEQLATDLIRLPILVTATFPHGGTDTSPALRTVIDQLERRRCAERFDVGAMSRADAGELIEALTGQQPPLQLVQALHEETDGNPFFLEEVVRHLADQDQLFDEAGAWRASPSIAVPDTIRLTVGRRLDVLTDKTHTLLTNAAIIGRAFGFQLLEALTDLTEDELVDALDEAERARLIASSIDSGGVRFRFEHELIRHTLVEGVSLARRQLLHQRVADAIERVHAATIDDHVSDLAYHLLEAGDRADPTRTLRFLVAAGERALEAAAYEEALRHLERALAMTPADDLSGRARILEELAMAHRSLGRPAEAIASWSEALDAYESLGDLETVARVCLDACIQVSWWANRPETFELIERGLRATRDEDDPGRAALLAMSAVMSSHLGSYHDAEEKLERALELARAQDNGRVLGVVLFTTCAHHFNYQQHEKAVEIGRVAIDQLRDAGDLWNLANVQGFVGQSLGFLGRFDEAATATEGAKALAERLGNWVAYVYIDRARAWRHMSRSPDPERLDADGVRDVELGEQLGYGWMSSLGYTRRSFAAFLTGRWEDALSLATESSRYEFGVGHGHLGRLVLLQAYLGDRDASCDAFERLRPGFPQQGDPAYVGAWDSFLAAVEGMAMLDEREALAELHPRVIDILTFNKLFRGWDYRLVLTVAGMSATCAGLWTEAEAHFTEAMRIADTLPYPTEQPEARRFYAWMLLQRDLPGDRSKAAELLQEAIAGYHHIGMPRHEALAAAMLQNA